MISSLKSQRGAAIIFAVLLLVIVVGIYYMSYSIKQTARRRAPLKQDAAIQRKKACELAVRKIALALEKERQDKGEYPYELNYEFLDRHKDLDRFVFNRELWSDESGNTVYLDTIFGTEFTLIGYCRNGNDYTYSSREKTIQSSRRVAQ